MESWSNPACRPSEGLAMNTVPREGCDDYTGQPELYTRTSWVDAQLAYRQIKKGKAQGNTCALWLRLHLQKYLYSTGCFIQLHCGKLVFVGILLLSLCCVGLKTGTIETNVEELWVQEGGRLEKELEYTRKTIGEGSGTSNEIIIQMPKKGTNILTKESLLTHLDAVIAATKIRVVVDGQTWTFSDLCYAASFQTTENNFFDWMLERILPCIVISPLDCFWEGSKILGPEDPLSTGGFAGIPDDLTWMNLNPQKLIQNLPDAFPVEYMNESFKRAGITTAYQKKYCLDPSDPDCPITAPNKHSGEIPDVAAVLTNGCNGFATKYMHWDEDLIVGGVRKNKTGHIVGAEAVQSIVQLMGEKGLYEYHQDTTKVQSIRWSRAKAKEILETWQRNFSQIINKFGNDSFQDNIYAFSYTSLLDIIKDFSSISVVRVVMGYVLMFVYALLSLLKWNDAVNSQSGIGMAGVLLVSLSVAAGLGICSVLNIKFNASTTQIIPFLALGLGVDDMFLIAHTYAEHAKDIPFPYQTGECLKRTGVTVLLTSLSNMLAFFTAAIIPIPALRAFSLQAALLVFFNMGSVLLIFPAIVSLDLVRREDKRLDVLCCFQSFGATEVIELQPRTCDVEEDMEQGRPPCYSPPPSYNAAVLHDTVARSSADGSHAITELASNEGNFVVRNPNAATGCPSTTSSRQCLTPEESVTCKERCVKAQRECLSWSLTCLATNYYGPFLQKTPVKVFVMVFFFIFFIIGIWGTAQVKDGLDLTDIVPRDTQQFKFLEAQSKYFGFYNMYAVTQGNFDYAKKQDLLDKYHDKFHQVTQIIKREDGTLPTFWLDIFRQWLLDLQKSFDDDVTHGCIVKDKWYHNATDDGILAYKLLVQTGNLDRPNDKEMIFKNRLVNEKGIINPDAFYNYLTAWAATDVIAYTSSMADFKPEPNSWLHDPSDNDLMVPKSQPLIYTQIPFYLTNLSNTEEIISLITEIRSICDMFSEEGLPNYPSGVPFTFWEQYINLRFYMMWAIICVLLVTFFVITITLMNPWLAFIVVVTLSSILVELFGFMGIVGIKLSAVPAVILIMTVGIGIEFTLHMSVGFITGIGNRNRRMMLSLQHTFAPVIHGAISTLLGIIMLVGAEFDFIVK
ncbi:protein patched homolog 1 isoform X2 [Patella vulgata]|nr:protein patched homolog 1 isoform X2 [Patella vulgata]